MNIIRRLAAVAFALAASYSGAQTCAGFTDVPAADPFCPNVEWIRNRAITLGCSGSTFYCPTAAVSRGQMAAFMNRLGSALTPVTLYQEAAPGAVTLNATGSEYCVTTAFPVTGFPRSASLHGAFALTAAGGVTFRGQPVYSTNGGTTWTPTAAFAARSTSGGGQWSTSSTLGTLQLTVGQTYLFAVRAINESGTAALADSRCQLSVVIDNRNGATPPYDAPTVMQ